MSSSSEDERMGLQIKPPPPDSSSSSSSKRHGGHERRGRDLASRLGPREGRDYSGSGGQERSSSKSHRHSGSSGDRRRTGERGVSRYSGGPYGDHLTVTAPGSGSSANWDRVSRTYSGSGGREFERDSGKDGKKRSIRDRLGPVDPNSRAGRYWEEKTSTSASGAQGSSSGNRSNELLKHKERRKHLEQEEERAFREIEKRRQRERREEERAERKVHGSSSRGKERQGHGHVHSTSRHANSSSTAANDGNRREEIEGEIEDDEGMLEVEEIEVSSASGGSAAASSAEEEQEQEEEEDGALHSDISPEERNSENEDKKHKVKTKVKVRAEQSASASAQNSEISSDEEEEEQLQQRQQGSSSSKESSSGDSESDSSSEESRSSGEDEGRRSHSHSSASTGTSPKAKRRRRSHSQSRSSSKRQENGNNSKDKARPKVKAPTAAAPLVEVHSHSESESDHDDEEENKTSDVEMIEDTRSDKEKATEAAASASSIMQVPEVKVEVELTPIEKKKLELEALPPYYPAIQGCRRVEEFKLLNRIEEGTYGVVYRAEDKRTNEIVALKRLKMEKEKDGFPITSLREINTLLKAQHENIVTVREIVVGSNTDKIFLVMDYVEHDLKALMETLKQKEQTFILVEIKCLMIQLLRAVAHLHDNWILHRDLKASNILLSHKGILKVGDFGLAREYGSPLKPYTPIVVTLWYRAPELLLQAKEYSTPIDMWSVGCIFGELLKLEPMFPGKSEANQLNLIFSTLGTPNDKIWPGYSRLPLLQKLTFTDNPVNKLKTKFQMLSELGIDLLNKMLTYNPAKRISAEDALKHGFFKERPLAIDPSVFSTWPAKSEMGHRKAASSPKPPSGGRQFKDLREEDDAAGFFLGLGDRRPPIGAGFNLKF